MDRFKLRRQQIFVSRIAWLLVLTLVSGYMHWDFDELKVTLGPPIAPPASAQSASQTFFAFKPAATSTSLLYWAATGPTAEFSTDADTLTGSPTGKTTAYSASPIPGATVPGTILTMVTGTENTVTANPKLWFRTFIMPLANNTMTFTSATTFSVRVAGYENNANANAFPAAFVYVWDPGSGNAKTLAGPTSHATELPTSAAANAAGRVWTVANTVGATSYTTNANDYLAVELWVYYVNSSATSYVAGLSFGGNRTVIDATGNVSPASGIEIGGTTVDTFDPIYLKPTSVDHEPEPGGHQIADAFPINPANTYDSRRANTVIGTGAEANAQGFTTVTTNSYKMNGWCSPPLAGSTTIPSAKWIVHFHGNETNAGNNAYARIMLYSWLAGDSMGTTIYATANMSTEFGAVTNDSNVEDAVAGSAVSLNAGDRVCMEAVMQVQTATVTGTVNFRFGSGFGFTTVNSFNSNTYDSAFLPPMNYTSTGYNAAPLQFRATTYEQRHWRFDVDDDVEVHTAWTDKNGATAEDTPAAYPTTSSDRFRLRVQVRNKGGENGNFQPALYYRDKGPPSGSWYAVTNGSTAFKIVLSAYVTQGQSTTAQLTAETGWDFKAGGMIEDSAGVGTVGLLTAWDYTEYEWSLQGYASGTYEFKVTESGGTDLEYNLAYPEVTFTSAAYTPAMNNWRWYADEEDEAVATPYADENTAPPQDEMGFGIPLKLRINLTETGGVAENDSRKKLRWSQDTLVWLDVPTSSLGAMFYFYDGGGNDNQTLSSKVLSDSSSGSLGIHNENYTDSPSNSDHPASTTVEFEYCIAIGAKVSKGVTYYFQIYDQVLAAAIPLGAGKSYPQFRVSNNLVLTGSQSGSVALGDFALGDSSYHTHTFIASEDITIRDNRGLIGATSSNSAGWTLSAVTTGLSNSSYTIAKTSIYWISYTTDVTPLYAAPTAGMSGNNGEYMGASVTVTSFTGSGIQGLGGFTIRPTMRVYDIIGVGDYTGTLTLTII